MWSATNWFAERDPNAWQGYPPWPTPPGAAWAAYTAIHNGYSIQPHADGSCTFEVHQGDRPGREGGDRSGLQMNVAYEGDPRGIDLVGRPGRELWYRVVLELPVGLNRPALPYHNNFGEWHGRAPGGSVLKFGVSADGTRWGVAVRPLVGGAWQEVTHLDWEPLVLGQVRDYLLGVLWSPGADGWVVVKRDGEQVGRLTGVQTMKTFATGQTENVAYGCQLYRRPAASGGATIPPSQLKVHRVAIAGSERQILRA